MRRAFDVAWFFHCAPSTVLALPLPELLEWERQAARIAGALRAAHE